MPPRLLWSPYSALLADAADEAARMADTAAPAAFIAAVALPMPDLLMFAPAQARPAAVAFRDAPMPGGQLLPPSLKTLAGAAPPLGGRRLSRHGPRKSFRCPA